MPDPIEAGYHFYNENESIFQAKEYPVSKKVALGFVAGVEAGKCCIKNKVVGEFKNTWDKTGGRD